MAIKDARVGVVQDRRLHAAVQQRLRLAHEVLIERVLAGDEHGEPMVAAAGAAPLLAEAGDRAREADRDDRVEEADVDPELESVRRSDAQQLSLDQPPFDFASLSRRVARTVRREPLRQLAVAEPLDGEAVDELGRLAALAEGERAALSLDEPGQEARRLSQGARPLAQLLVQER